MIKAIKLFAGIFQNFIIPQSHISGKLIENAIKEQLPYLLRFNPKRDVIEEKISSNDS